jgi:uncharacterized membrane protein YfcA
MFHPVPESTSWSLCLSLGLFQFALGGRANLGPVQQTNSQHVIAERGPAHTLGVKHLGFSVTRWELTFGNEHFDYNPWVPILVGVGIAVISSALGVGGGFLLVPFMSKDHGLLGHLTPAEYVARYDKQSTSEATNF